MNKSNLDITNDKKAPITNNLEIVTEDEVQIEGYIKDAISIDNFVKTFNENSHETLLKLLAIQDNKHPLKKGGISIAYRTDALIMHCKMEFTAAENIVFDAILGVMSTFPENDTYIIAPSNFSKYQKYDSDLTLYITFKNGVEKLKNRLLIFDELGEDGNDEIIVPWFEIMRYHGKKEGENAYIEFKPTAFFKDLALCSQIVHGAYGSLTVTTQLRGKYSIAIYWFLENKKKYKEYPNATPGVFVMSTSEIRHQFCIPEKYRGNDIKTRVIEPAKKSINSINECDFTFDYEVERENGKISAFKFYITEKNYSDNVESTSAIEEDPMFNQILSILNIAELEFTTKEISRIYKCAKRNGKSATDIMMIAAAFIVRYHNTDLDPIADKVSYFCKMIEHGTSPDSSFSKSDSFHNFQERTYDYGELERKLRKN